MLKQILCSSLIACAITAFCEEPVKTLQGGTVTVTGEEPVRNLLQTPSAESASLEIATSTVDRQEIRKQNAANLTEALNFAPGIHTETRGRKYKNFTSFRGQIYPYPTYALNGLWQREFNELVYMLPASQIEKVDVVRSSGTLLMGLADITGVINVLPKKYEKPTTMIEGEVGTFNTWRTGISHGNSGSNGWYTVGANANATDGPGGRNAAERTQSVYGQGGAQVNDRLTLEGQFFAIRGSRELMTPDPDGPALNSLKNRTEEYEPFDAFSIGGKAIFEQNSKASLELSAGYSERNYHYTRRKFKPTETDEDDYEYSLQLMQALQLSDANTLRFGGVYNHWISPEGKRSYSGQRQDVETYAVVVVDEHQFDKLTLDAGLRLMRDYYNEYSGTSFNIQGNSRDFDIVRDKWGDPLLTATFGAKYVLSTNVSLYAHIAGGERSADPGALSATGSSLANENRLMIDAGVKLEDQNVGMLKLGGFYTLRKDAVTKTSQLATNSVTGNEFYLSDNQDITQYGLELESRTAPIGGMATLFFNATLMESRFKAAGASSYGDYVEIPDAILSGGLYTEIDRFDFNLFGKYVSDYSNSRFAQDGAQHKLGDYLEINATAGYTFGKKYNTRVYASVANLLDDEYSTVVGWSDPGTEFRVGLQHEF